MKNKEQKIKAYEEILQVMDELREKCPWDKKQTFESLRPMTIEEVHELSEAILKNDISNMEEELGDILLHILFYAKIGEEKEQFDMATIAKKLKEKLIRRHPHVYGENKELTDTQVAEQWEQIKKEEGKKSVLEGLPKGLPSIQKAYTIQKKAGKVGFEWPDISGVLEKLDEEWDELKEAIQENNQNHIKEELGDIFFVLVNICRHLNMNPDEVLEGTNQKFIQRFQWMENAIEKQDKNMLEMSLEEMDTYWDKAKEALKKG